MSDNSKNKGKKRTKAYYLKCSKQGRHKARMEIGQKGFLVTCNNREKECIREMYSLLNNYADKLYGPEKPDEIEKEEGVLDIEEEVRREVESLKKRLLNERRFQALDSKARNCIFISAKVPDPSHLIHEILTDIQTTQKQCSRYILRATPVLSICRASLDDIKSCAEKLLPQYFEGAGPKGKSYAIIFKVRNNATLSRTDVIPAIGSIISRLSPSNKADLNSPDLAVLVDVIGKLCCLGITEDYYRLKKYNLAELINKTGSRNEDTKTGSRNEEAKTETRNEEAKTETRNEEAKTETRNEEAKTETRNEEAKTESRNEEAKTESRNEEAKTNSSELKEHDEHLTADESESPRKTDPNSDKESADV